MYEITDEASLRHAIQDYIKFTVKNVFKVDIIVRRGLVVRKEALSSKKPREYPTPENKRIEKYKENGVHRKTATQNM